MKPNEYLADFVARALAAGEDRERIRETLKTAGWQETEIRRALGQWGDPFAGVPVPRPAAHVSAREAFTYALLFVGLGMLVWHINALGFDLIDTAFATPDDYGYDWRSYSIRWSIAVLVVIGPVFLWLNRAETRKQAADPGRVRSAIRKWFGFVILFFAVMGMVGDLIATIYALLSGDLTLQFIAKAALVLLTSVLVFLYYRRDLEQGDEA